MNERTPPNPSDLADRVAEINASAPTVPVFPPQWQATVLLSPYGDANPPNGWTNYSQHVIGEVSYDVDLGMMVGLYLPEDLKYFRFLFVNGEGWYWIDAAPRGPMKRYFGPFATPLKVPGADFMSRSKARFGERWEITNTSCVHWVLPTPNSSSPPDHGSWYSFRSDNGNLYRIFTFDPENPRLFPVLGSYYLAHVPSFEAGADSELQSLVKAVKSGKPAADGGYVNPLLTQRDIQTAMTKPLASAPCTLAQIQAVIPGYVPLPSGVPLPVWTDKTFILGMCIGTDLIPYYTFVSYWYSFGKQQTIFIGLGQVAGEGNYALRQDCCLFRDYTDVPQYVAQGNTWVLECCSKIPGVGLPVPNWVSADGGVVAASISGNADFGLKPNEVLNLCRCSLDRGPGNLALFWVWFTGDQKGVLFTEANFVDSTDHNLQLIDYTWFDRNAEWLKPDAFSDPCTSSSPICPSSAALAARPPAARMFGPRRIL